MNPWRWLDPRIADVRLADVQSYLLSQGWQQCPDANPTALRYEHSAQGNGSRLFQLIPASEQYPDFPTRIAELITTLSEIEERHPVVVLNDILGQA